MKSGDWLESRPDVPNCSEGGKLKPVTSGWHFREAVSTVGVRSGGTWLRTGFYSLTSTP